MKRLSVPEAINIVFKGIEIAKKEPLGIVALNSNIILELEYDGCCLDDLAMILSYSHKCEFKQMDEFFKTAQQMLRLRALGSLEMGRFFDRTLRVAFNNPNEQDIKRTVFTKEEAGIAINKVFDQYDPNVTQSPKNKVFNWVGISKIVKIHPSVTRVAEIYMPDLKDHEVFFQSIRDSQKEQLKKALGAFVADYNNRNK